jgi:hypothetical protein
MVERCREAEQEIAAEVAERGMKAFALAVAAPNVEVAAGTIIQSHGVGPLRTNTILLNWLDAEGSRDATGVGQRLFVRTLRAAVRLGVNVVVLDAKEEACEALDKRQPTERRIDLWWSDNSTGRLMLLLAYMATRSEDWRGAAIRLLVWVRAGAEEKMEASLASMLEDVRIDAAVETVADLTPEALVDRSRDAALVLLPLRLHGPEAVDLFNRPIDAVLEGLPMVAMVAAAGDISLDAEPEETPEADQDTGGR